MNKAVVGLLIAAGVLAAQEARQIVEEATRRARSSSQRYEGTLQVIGSGGRISDKRWVYERIGSEGASKAVLRFIAPPEVKGVALLVIHHKDRASDQWMWTPAIQRERRIALQDRSTRFFGTDFSFEDLEESEPSQYDYRLAGEEKLEGVDCWKIESRPRPLRASQYTHSLTWIRKDRYLGVQSERYDRGGLARRIEWSEFEQVKGIWTPKRLEVFDNRRNSRTVMKLEKLDYNVPMKDEDFTLQALRRGS